MYVDTEDSEKLGPLVSGLLTENTKLKQEIAESQEELKKLHEHLRTRIAIEEARPRLKCGHPCPKCGQIYNGG